MADIVPFGKYKGQPVEEVAADPQYSEWLMAQEWFRQRFAKLYALLAANQAPSETPEHNAMQALFLDEAFCWRVARAVTGKSLHVDLASEKEHSEQVLEKLVLKRYPGPYYDEAFRAAELKTVKVAYHEKPKMVAVFELEGADVELRYTLLGLSSIDGGYGSDDWTCPHRLRWAQGGRLRLELKPQLGDDYPAVLRQAMAASCSAVVVGHYHGVGAPVDSVRKIFSTRNIKLLTIAEIEKQEGTA